MAEEVSTYLINQPMDSKIIPLTVTMSISETITRLNQNLELISCFYRLHNITK